jgi:hypothetical protein
MSGTAQGHRMGWGADSNQYTEPRGSGLYEAELGKEARELQQRVEPVEDAHMGSANHLHVLQLDLFLHLVISRNPEKSLLRVSECVGFGGIKQCWAYLYNVLRRVSLSPQVVEKVVRLMDISVEAQLDHFVSKFRVRLIANLKAATHCCELVIKHRSRRNCYLEYIGLINDVESGRATLNAVDSLSHISVGSKNDCFKPIHCAHNLQKVKAETSHCLK